MVLGFSTQLYKGYQHRSQSAYVLLCSSFMRCTEMDSWNTITWIIPAQKLTLTLLILGLATTGWAFVQLCTIGKIHLGSFRRQEWQAYHGHGSGMQQACQGEWHSISWWRAYQCLFQHVIGVSYNGDSQYKDIFWPNSTLKPTKVELADHHTCHLRKTYKSTGMGSPEPVTCNQDSPA